MSKFNECAIREFRLGHLVDLAYTLVAMDRDLGAALLFADVMAELRNRLPPTSYAELQNELREEKAQADAERQSRTHTAPEAAQ
jgi:hypothetical protein